MLWRGAVEMREHYNDKMLAILPPAIANLAHWL